MKKALSLFIVAALLLGCALSCGTGGDKPASGPKKLSIVTTVFPQYDWVRNVLGEAAENAELTLLLDSGVDLHSYQPTAADMLKIINCDLFIYVGGESDEWVVDALKRTENRNMRVLSLMDALGDLVKTEEHIEGMQEDEDGHDDEHGEAEFDEHVWLSLRNASSLVESISEAVQKLDPENADAYRKNTEAYIEKLNALDAKYRAAVSEASVKTLLFADRFPFRYLADDYGLTYFAAFAGCSAETEAGFETLSFLARKVDELALHAVMTTESSDGRLAETVVQSTESKDASILALDSMQSVTAKDVDGGAAYLTIMESNLAVLTDALK